MDQYYDQNLFGDAVPASSEQLSGLARRMLAGCAPLPTQSAEFTEALEQVMLGTRLLTHFEAPGACISLCRESGPLARWTQLGDDEVFEPIDGIYRDTAAALMLAEELARQSRPLELSRIPADSPIIPALKSAMHGRGLVSVRPATPSPYLALDDGWCEPESQFSSRRRSDFRRALRRAQEFGDVGFETLAPTAAGFEPLFDLAVEIEARSWKRAAGSALACDPVKQAFFRHYLTAASARGECRISLMRIDGQPVAMQLATVWGGRNWLFKIGHDEAFSRCSPGGLLMLHAIGAAAREGLAGFEMLGESESWISELWTRAEHERVRLRTYPFSPAGMAALAVDGFAWGKARLRGHGAA